MENINVCHSCIWFDICIEDEICDDFYQAGITGYGYDDKQRMKNLSDYRNDWFEYISDFECPEDGSFV